ncbi:hypothetical protein BLA60_37730 [Actinophytocola xinjiangensis]|uniref:Uncharacterized protein n=1 Tax=Actinophytocola xinjiangensis TaxID=485602 RepID=A0A7Z0WDY1_9PSEU|nr:hypothetical protein [Actinophytocola xinjiangensis]OLF05122.1 hypothetical protein BLA60_37730 [Actinophytocola xinjiangensis]
MTLTSQPEDPRDGDEGSAWSVMSDEELAEVVAEALTSEVVSRAEETLLDDVTAVADTERIDRLDADRRLVEYLAATGFAGQRFEVAFSKLARRLFSYAFPIMTLWVRDGTIFGECARYRGRVDTPAAAAAAAWSAADRAEVVIDSIIDAVDFFLDYALRKGKWDHRRGATLTTYFVGSCVCCFIKVCNARWKHQQLEEAFIRSAPRTEDDGGDLDDPVERIPSPDADPADLVATRDHAAGLWSRISDEKLREGLAWHLRTGGTQAAAAAEVGLSPKAFERRLHRQRTKLRPPDTASEDEGRS